MALLTREDILGVEDLRLEEVDVSEWWGGSVMVRGLTGEERDQFEMSMFTGRGKNRKENFENLRARLIVLCTCDADGKRLFNMNDSRLIGRKNAAPLDAIYAKAQELSGMRPKDVEEMLGNSPETGSEDSPSD